jgi:hypothetical protein
MTAIFEYPRRPAESGPSLQDQLITAWTVADRLAQLLVGVDRDKALEAVGIETETMLGPARTPSEAAESEGLIYTLRVALGIVDEAGYPLPSA